MEHLIAKRERIKKDIMERQEGVQSFKKKDSVKGLYDVKVKEQTLYASKEKKDKEIKIINGLTIKSNKIKKIIATISLNKLIK